MKNAQKKIDRIMGEAYDRAFEILASEVRKFMRQDARFVEYIHAVGWGPAFVLADGSTIEYAHKMPTKKGRLLLEWCDEFFDIYGAGNERVRP